MATYFVYSVYAYHAVAAIFGVAAWAGSPWERWDHRLMMSLLIGMWWPIVLALMVLQRDRGADG